MMRAAKPGDDVRVKASGSLLNRPTPFEISWLGGRLPWWKRYVYNRLVWKKPSGASLEMRWRYEQRWYAKTGWGEPLMMWNSQTGLLCVKIQQDWRKISPQFTQPCENRPVVFASAYGRDWSSPC
jgi:hypothetical protein